MKNLFTKTTKIKLIFKLDTFLMKEGKNFYSEKQKIKEQCLLNFSIFFFS